MVREHTFFGYYTKSETTASLEKSGAPLTNLDVNSTPWAMVSPRSRQSSIVA